MRCTVLCDSPTFVDKSLELQWLMPDLGGFKVIATTWAVLRELTFRGRPLRGLSWEVVSPSSSPLFRIGQTVFSEWAVVLHVLAEQRSRLSPPQLRSLVSCSTQPMGL